MKRVFAILLVLALVLSAVPPALAAGRYTDVPADSWAVSYIEKAKTYGLMNGTGAGRFGYGKSLSRAEAAQLICNLLGWELLRPDTPSFADVPKGEWYYGAVETFQAHGGVDSGAGAYFRPDAPITREEIAEAFIRILGLSAAAEIEERQPSVFSDVTGQQGYIQAAAAIGLMQGIGGGRFDPDGTAKREEAAAMLVRFYEKYYRNTEFLHGYYAFSSYSQRELAKKMDAVTYQWSEMRPDGTLDTSGGECRIPESYESILQYLGGGVKQHLGVFLGKDADQLLLSETARAAAVRSILDELERTYERVGANPYSGVTIDFEGLRGEDVKAGFNAFLTDLSGALRGGGKTLYVTVHPAVPSGSYFDGFDYRAIGRLADKVILMAHDYAPLTLAGLKGTTWYEKGALTPIGQVYYSLKAALDAESGVEDPGKLVLALSMDAQGWELDENDKLAAEEPVSIRVQRMEEVLAAGEERRGYSVVDQNPWAVYRADDGTRLFAWYEDAESIQAKISLAKCFGVTGISVWRLGNIPGDAACRRALGLAE